MRNTITHKMKSKANLLKEESRLIYLTCLRNIKSSHYCPLSPFDQPVSVFLSFSDIWKFCCYFPPSINSTFSLLIFCFLNTEAIILYGNAMCILNTHSLSEQWILVGFFLYWFRECVRQAQKEFRRMAVLLSVHRDL